MNRRRRRLAIGATVVVALAVAAIASVRDGDRDGRPTALVDGSPAHRAPRELRLGSDAVLARTRVRPSSYRDADLRACFRLAGVTDEPASRMVEIVGAAGRSLTFRVAGGRALAACEASARTLEPRGGPWCGAAHGRLYGGRLRDGRLSLVSCLDEERRAVAFGWIEPERGARWLAVRDERTTEVYRVVPGFPVRATTSDVDADTASAVFDVTHYAGDGRRLSAERVRMRVAG